MHANISTTDGICGMLSENDMREQISLLGKKISKSDDQEIATLLEAVKKLEKRLENFIK